MDLTFQVTMQYSLYSIGPCFYHQSHPQLGVVFDWFHPFILSGVISPLTSSSILDTYQPGEFIFQYPIFAFSYCSWGSQGKNTEVVCHSLLQWTTFCHDQPRQHIKKQRDYFANKDPYSQSYGFSSSNVWMWELEYKESWVQKNWCF